MTNQSFAKSTYVGVLMICGGRSSITFAVFAVGDPLRRILEGGIERIGLSKAFWGR
jgi:hypothetical protein